MAVSFIYLAHLTTSLSLELSYFIFAQMPNELRSTRTYVHYIPQSNHSYCVTMVLWLTAMLIACIIDFVLFHSNDSTTHFLSPHI